MSLTIYSQSSTITVGSTLYTSYQNFCLGVTAPNGYYSDGVNCFTVTGGAGVVSSSTPCGVTTFTISIYARVINNTVADSYQLQASTNGGSTYFGVGSVFTSSTCSLKYTGTYSVGTTVYIAVYNNTQNEAPSFAYASGSSCPTSGGTSCNIPPITTTSSYSITVNAATYLVC